MKALRERIHFSDHLRSLTSRNATLRDATLGFVACAAAAGVITAFLRRSSGVESLPLLFLVIVAVVAHRFGTSGAIVGLVSGGIVFAEFLFPPIGELRIDDDPARTNVVMMLLFGMAVAYFYGANKNDDDQDGAAQ